MRVPPRGSAPEGALTPRPRAPSSAAEWVNIGYGAGVGEVRASQRRPSHSHSVGLPMPPIRVTRWRAANQSSLPPVAVGGVAASAASCQSLPSHSHVSFVR